MTEYAAKITFSDGTVEVHRRATARGLADEIESYGMLPETERIQKLTTFVEPRG